MRPRGATVRPRSVETVGQRCGERRGALVDVGPARVLEHVVGGQRGRDRLGALRRASWRRASGCGSLSRPAPGSARFMYVAPSSPRRSRQAGEIQSIPVPGGPAQPLLARAGVEVAARARRRRRGRRRRPGRRRAAPGTSVSARPSGRSEPLTQLTCEQATSFVRGPIASARSASGAVRIVTPCRRRSVTSGPSRPGCSSGAVRTSSPGAKSMPASTRTTPSLVERRQGDVLGLRGQPRGVGRAQAVAQVHRRVEVGANAALERPRARSRRVPR